MSKGKGERVRRMFDAIAPAYDQLNRLISLGLDKRWRDLTVRCVAEQAPARILDLAAGTGDLSIALADAIPEAHVVAGDLSEGMLEIAAQKAQVEGLSDRIDIKVCDALALPYDDGTFDAVTCAFGVRNFEDLGAGLEEMCRVIRPGGMVAILELCEPRYPMIYQLYRFHAFTVIPWLGKRLSDNKGAYTYLPDSISRVPQGREMTDLMVAAGLVMVNRYVFLPGVCTLYVGYRPMSR